LRQGAKWVAREISRLDRHSSRNVLEDRRCVASLVERIYRGFHARDGRRVVLRTPRMSDLDEFLEFINSLVDEGAEILVEMMQVLVEESRKAGLKLLRLSVFGSNMRAKHVYGKAGFREVGRIPKAISKGDEYVDEVWMALEL